MRGRPLGRVSSGLHPAADGCGTGNRILKPCATARTKSRRTISHLLQRTPVMKHEHLTAERVRGLLHYEPPTGELTWRVSRGGTARAGRVAGRIMPTTGYRQISIDDRRYLAHRLAWLYVYGVWPPDEIDHINGVKDDNRLSNLRLATHKQNKRNTKRQKNNTSGVTGVRYHKRRKKWVAEIRVNGKNIHLGYFDTLEEAMAARLAALRFYGFDPLHGMSDYFRYHVG